MLDSSNSPLQMREKLYLLAVGHYRSGDYSRSRQLLERCLEVCSHFFLLAINLCHEFILVTWITCCMSYELLVIEVHDDRAADNGTRLEFQIACVFVLSS